MKRIFRLYRNWRYRRLYRKLLWHFLKRGMSGQDAASNADMVFMWVTAQEWDDFLLHDCLGVPRGFSSNQDISPSSCRQQ